jgi:16S rRNA (cytosine967-C5)-methyltransferase
MSHARNVALKVLVRVEQGGAFAAAALNAELAGMRDSRDAALTTELVLGVLRRLPWLDYLLESASNRQLDVELPIRQILRMGAYQIAFLERVPNHAAVSEAVNQTEKADSPRLKGLVNAVLRNLTRKPPESLLPPEEDDGVDAKTLACRLGMPTWLFDRFITARQRDGAVTLARHFNSPSRRTMRVNINRISLEELIAKMPADTAKAGILSPWAMDMSNPNVAAKLAEEGSAVIQDEGAQLVALALEPKPEDTILDACAGRGGKSAALLMAANGKAKLTAVDRGVSKLERLTFDLTRQGFEATTKALDLTGDTERLGGPFDRVLLDAPCSGSGTLGRRPEIRWRLSSKDISSLVRVQSKLLESVSSFVAPGGRLVYAVCSLLPEEGAARFDSFLRRHPDFCATKTPPKDWPDAVPWNGGKILVDPTVTDSDGYQILCFDRS